MDHTKLGARPVVARALMERPMIKENWRVILLTLLAANLVFMALLEVQRLAIWRTEQEYFARIQQPSTEKFDYLAKELSETKKTQTGLLDLIYKELSETKKTQTGLLDLNYRLAAEINTRVIRVETATAKR
jgi:hypothetical protein